LGHHLARRRSLKAPAFYLGSRGFGFSGPAAFKLQLWPKAKRPSDVQQWRAAPDQGAEGDAGPSEQRAAERSARRRREAPKPQRAATTSPLGRSSTTEWSKRSAARRSRSDNKPFRAQFDD